MEQNKIICHNCGAENEYGGKCQYCGSPLKNADADTPVVEQLDGDLKTIDDKYHLLETTYDEFNKMTEYKLGRNSRNKLISNVFLRNQCGDELFARVSQFHGEGISIIKKCYPDREEFYLRCNVKSRNSTMELLIDRNKKISITPSDWVRGDQAKRDGNCEFKITQNTLYEICQAHSIKGRIQYNSDEETLYVGDLYEASRLFYHLLCDNTQFVDTYNLVVKNMEEEKRKKEEKEKQEIENARKQRIEQIALEKKMKRNDTISTIAGWVSSVFCILFLLFLGLTIITNNDSSIKIFGAIAAFSFLVCLIANAIYKQYSD